MTVKEVLDLIASEMRQVKYNAETRMRNTGSSDEKQVLSAQIEITNAYLDRIRELKNQLI